MRPPHDDSWHGALDSEPRLQGRVLDRRSFVVLRDAIAKRELAITGKWLNVVGTVLSDAQVKELLTINKTMALATTDDLLQTLAVGELVEAACQKLQPWDAPVTLGILPAEIGLPTGVEPLRREWAYRYRRGLVDATVGEQEQVDVWRGYPSSLSAPVHALTEIKPGTLAVSTLGGHVRLWSSAFRGQWAVTGHMAGPTAEGYRIAALSPVHVVGFSPSAVAIWHAQPFGTWSRIFEWTHGGGLRGLAVLSPQRFVVLSGTGTLLPFRSPTRGQWASLPMRSTPHPITGIAALDKERLVSVGSPHLLFSFTDKGLTAEPSVVSFDHSPTSIVATAVERVFVTFGAGQVRLVRIDDTGTAETLNVGSSALPVAQLVESTGHLVLLRNDAAFEIWSTAPDKIVRVGEGGTGGASRVSCSWVSCTMAAWPPGPARRVWSR